VERASGNTDVLPCLSVIAGLDPAIHVVPMEEYFQTTI
jgi:hypothetical protein